MDMETKGLMGHMVDLNDEVLSCHDVKQARGGKNRAYQIECIKKWTGELCLKKEANEEDPKTCILSFGQQDPPSLVEKKTRNDWLLMWKDSVVAASTPGCGAFTSHGFIDRKIMVRETWSGDRFSL